MPLVPPDCRVRLRLPPGLDGLIARHRAGPDCQFHRHAELELNLVVGGHARYEMDDGLHDLVAGSLVWLFPARPHRLVAQSADFSMWVLVVRRSAHARWRRVLEPAARRDLAADDPALAPCRHLADGDASDLHHALRALAGLTAWPGAFRAALDFAVVLAWRAYQRAPADGRPLHPAVQRALAALRAQPTLDGAALAAHAGMSRARLSGRFRAETGESLVDCRNRLRIERILAAPPRSGGLLAAALAAGFGSYAQFHRAFRRATGSSPRAWLARQPQPHYL